MPNYSDFKMRISELRDQSGYTQEDLAEKLNYSVSGVKRWTRESTTHFPNQDTMISLANIFNVDIGYLYGDQKYRHISEQRIIDLTGLSEISAENLSKLKAENPQAFAMLDYLLGDKPEKGINLLFLLYHYLFGNYQKIKGFDNHIIDLVDDTGFGGVALDISDLNAALKTMIDKQIYSIKTDIDSKRKDYGKDIPAKDEAELVVKQIQAEIALAKSNIEKHNGDKRQQEFWRERLSTYEQILKRYQKLLETRYSNPKEGE